jgi:hypothetical protein
MNAFRSTAISAGLTLLTSLGGLMLAACDIVTEVGFGASGGGGSGGAGAGGSGGAGAGGSGAGGSGGSGGQAVVIFDAAGTGLNLWQIAVDASNAYVTDAQGPSGKVLQVPLDGSPETVLADGQSSPTAVAVDATDVYFISSYDLKKVPIGGGAAVQVAPAEDASFSGLFLDDVNVYWTNYTYPGSTMFIPKAGGAPTVVDTGDNYPSGIVVRAGIIYWSVLSDDVIKQAPVAGGPATVFADDQSAPRLGFAANDTDLYWITEGDFPNQIMTAPLAGGPPVQLAVSPSDASTQTTMVLDATHAYFVLPYCAIGKMPLAGGVVDTITPDPSVGCPKFLTGDAANLYYTSEVGVTKLPK